MGTNTVWDNKFGMLEDNYTQRMQEQEEAKVLGVGKEEPTITNSRGGKQSSSPYEPCLLDPDFLDAMVNEEGPLHYVAQYMRSPEDSTPLFLAIEYRQPGEEELNRMDIVANRLLTISKVLKEGAEKYETNNWRLIPSEQHLSHAITHYLAYLLDDNQDDHLSHFYTRLMMCYATVQSTFFSYTSYLTKD